MNGENKLVTTEVNFTVDTNSRCEVDCSHCYSDTVDDLPEYMYTPGSDQYVIIGQW